MSGDDNVLSTRRMPLGGNGPHAARADACVAACDGDLRQEQGYPIVPMAALEGAR